MRNFFYSLIISLLFTLSALAQTEGISFQGLARNASGEVLVSQKISLRLSILLDTESGAVAYVETRQVTTNPQGIFSLVVGDDKALTKSTIFSAINWTSAPKFIKVEMDPNGGTSFVAMGTSRLQAAPFAFYAYGVDAGNVKGLLPVASGGTGVASISELKTRLGLDNFNNAALDTKVDKVAGKGLSSNDYTTAEKSKLAGITGTNTGDQDLSSYATTSQLATKANASDLISSLATKANVADVTISLDTKANASEMMTSLATKVDKEIGKGLSTNDYTTAEKTKLAAITGNNTGQDLSGYATTAQLANKANASEVTTSLATKVNKEIGKGLSTNDYTTAEKTKLAAITGNNTGQDLSGYATTAQLANKANASDVTTGLAAKANASDVTTSLASKVDKVTGKELSTNDYTTAEKTKLGAISGTNTGDQDLSGYATTGQLATKANIADVTTSLATKEDSSNKSNAALGTSTTFYPTQNAVKTYVDAQILTVTIADADATTRGKIQLAGDLTGSATSPTIASGVVTSAKILDATIVNADIATAAAIEDTKLATIATSGKVSNSATTATDANTASTIVARDASGNFTAGTITANLTGNASTATKLAATKNINGTAFDGSADITLTAAAGTLSGTSLNSTVVSSSLTSVGTLTNLTVTNPITGSITGNAATAASATSFSGNLSGDVTGAQSATVVGKINGTSLAGLSTGLLKNTTSTGVPSIATVGTDYAAGTSALATGILKSTTTTGVLTIASASDFPTLNQNTTGNAANVTGTVGVGNGGTGATTLTGYVKGSGTSVLTASATIPVGDLTGTLPITAGGTGASTKAAAFDALSPMTASGDLIYGGTSGTGTRLAKGTNGQVLTLASGVPSWSTPAAGGSSAHYVGEAYGGGIVFFVWDNGAHGLIVALNEIGNKGPRDFTSTTGMIWGPVVTCGAFRSGYGGGEGNTNVMISKISNTGQQWFVYAQSVFNMYSAMAAQQYNSVYGDWYLPSAEELKLIRANQSFLTGSGYNNTHVYWSSTETNDSYAYGLALNGTTPWYQKNTLNWILPVRKF